MRANAYTSLIHRTSRGAVTDTYGIYIDEIARYPLLTREQETELGQRAHAGDDDAVAALVLHNLRFVVAVAKEYDRPGRQLMDLIEDGNMGLLKAASRYNPETGARFCHYAREWIHQTIRLGLSETSDDVRIKRRRRQLVRKIERLQEDALAKCQRALSPAELAEATGRPLEVVTDALRHQVDVVSLSDPIGDDSGRTLADTVAVSDAIEEQEIVDEHTTLIRGAMRDAGLTPRERSVVEAYYGLGQFRDGTALTLAEIGAHFHVGRERIRQVRDKALRKLTPFLQAAYHRLGVSWTPRDRYGERLQAELPREVV